MNELIMPPGIDRNSMADELMKFGAVSIPLVGIEDRQELLRTSRGLMLSGQDYEGVSFKTQFLWPNSRGKVAEFGRRLSSLVTNFFGKETKSLLGADYVFNEYTILEYAPGTRFKPHADHRSYRRLICVVIVEGEGRFYTYPNTQEVGLAYYSDRYEISATPGNVIFLRATDFNCLEGQVIHEVDEIVTRRYSIVYRYQD